MNFEREIGSSEDKKLANSSHLTEAYLRSGSELSEAQKMKNVSGKKIDELSVKYNQAEELLHESSDEFRRSESARNQSEVDLKSSIEDFRKASRRLVETYFNQLSTNDVFERNRATYVEKIQDNLDSVRDVRAAMIEFQGHLADFNELQQVHAQDKRNLSNWLNGSEPNLITDPEPLLSDEDLLEKFRAQDSNPLSPNNELASDIEVFGDLRQDRLSLIEDLTVGLATRQPVSNVEVYDVVRPEVARLMEVFGLNQSESVDQTVDPDEGARPDSVANSVFQTESSANTVFQDSQEDKPVEDVDHQENEEVDSQK